MIGGKDWGGGVARDGGSQAKNIRASCIIPRCSAPWRRMTMEEEGGLLRRRRRKIELPAAYHRDAPPGVGWQWREGEG